MSLSRMEIEELSRMRERSERIEADWKANLLCHNLNFSTWLKMLGHRYSYQLFFGLLFMTSLFGFLTGTSLDPVQFPVTFAIGMNSAQDAFKNNRAKKNVIVAGGLILVCITLLSCVSSFMIYREGFGDTPWFVQQSLSLFAVIVVEGAFIWLVYGFTRAFSSFAERIIALAGMGFLVMVMLTNIITHFMMVKHLALSPFQEAWLAWGAVSVFIAVLIFVLLITLSDPVVRLIRLEMRYLGKTQETILHAKTDGLDSEHIQLAMIERAEIEARELAERIIGDSRTLPRGGQTRLNQQSYQGPYRTKPGGKSKNA